MSLDMHSSVPPAPRMADETGGSVRRADSLSAAEKAIIYLILAGASLAYNYNFILIDYVRPFLTRHDGMTLAQTAWLYTAQGSGVILGSFLVPVLISRFHAKPVLISACFCLAALTAAGLLADVFAYWLASRFFVGIALAGTYISATTTLANLFPPRLRGRLLSINAAMFSVALLCIGALGASLGEQGWRTLIWIAATAPVVIGGIALLWLPSDKSMIVYADLDIASSDTDERGSWREMLSGRRLWLTLACLLLAGLNFSAYQFYSGFITTYLVTVRHFSSSVTGLFVIIDGVGTLIGTLLWGAIADRYGRRTNAIGFALATVFIVAFLVSPVQAPALMIIELGYATCLSCTYVWSAYFAELFPVRLRPMGTGLFHGGHIISLFAPLIITVIARHASLPVGMALAPATFAVGALLWWLLPETLRSARGYRGFVAEHP